MSDPVREDFDRIAVQEEPCRPVRWNHNGHYHRFLLGKLPARRDGVLDIGCGTCFGVIP